MRPQPLVVRIALGFWLVIGACGWTVPLPSPQPGEDEKNFLYTFARDSSGRVVRTRQGLPASIYQLRLAPSPKPTAIPRAPSRIQPRLDSLRRVLPESTRVQVMISYQDPIRMPRFPRRPPPGKSWPPADSIALTLLADSMVTAVQVRRDSVFQADSSRLADADSSAVVLRKYWIAQARLVEMRIGRIGAVLANPTVTYITLNASGEPPPCDGSSSSNPKCTGSDQECVCKTINTKTANTPLDARTAIGAASGRWAESGGTDPIGLLDTGVRSTHIAFSTLGALSTPLHLRTRSDLVDHVKLGDGPLPASSDDSDTRGGHGTSSAAILTSVPCPDDRFRGVTDAPLDVFNVYEPGSFSYSGLNRDAVLLALQGAIFDASTGTLLDPVVVAEMQALGSDHCDVNDAADGAFGAGAAVIAAQGNADEVPGSQVASPARARGAIGVGGFSVLNPGSPPNGQCSGPTDELRVKPDLLGPTDTWVAGNREIFSGCVKNADRAYHGFTATSGATPYAAGAAALLAREFGSLSPPATDPGNVYAGLILCGPQIWSGAKAGTTSGFDSDRGVGNIMLPSLSPMLWAGNCVVPSVTLDVEIPIDLTGMSGVSSLEAAIWWPDPTLITLTFRYVEVDCTWAWPRWMILPRVWPPNFAECRRLVRVPVWRVSYVHSDVDLELVPPSSTTAVASSLDGPSVFERTRASIANRFGKWTLRISGAALPAGAQTVYYAVTAR